jgi:hypothetical protein
MAIWNFFTSYLHIRWNGDIDIEDDEDDDDEDDDDDDSSFYALSQNCEKRHIASSYVRPFVRMQHLRSQRTDFS